MIISLFEVGRQFYYIQSTNPRQIFRYTILSILVEFSEDPLMSGAYTISYQAKIEELSNENEWIDVFRVDTISHDSLASMDSNIEDCLNRLSLIELEEKRNRILDIDTAVASLLEEKASLVSELGLEF